MEEERPVTNGSAQLFPPPSPGELAEAGRISADTDSNTIAGLQRLVFLSAQKNLQLSERYLEDARTWSRSFLTTTAEVVTSLKELTSNSLGMQRDHAAYMEMARKPIQPRPTLAETTAHTVEHIVTELRKSLKLAFAKDPVLQGKAQKVLDEVVEQGKAMLEGVGAGQPEEDPGALPAEPATGKSAAAPAAPTSPGPAPPAMRTYTKEEVIAWMDAVGMPFCERLFARFGVTKPEDITGEALASLHQAYQLLGLE